MSKLDWETILAEGAAIVESYDTGVSLRQLFYRLVSVQLLPNTDNSYKGLSRQSAKARRAGTFPDLIDTGRKIFRFRTFEGHDDALEWLRKIYRRKRDEHMEHSIYIGVEKLALAEQLQSWFGQLGIAIVVLRGYPSQSYVDQIVKDVEKQDRPAVFIYAGDFDASGEDIERDFIERTDCWDSTERIALTPQQIIDFNLPPLPGKRSDSRSAAFELKHGQLIQVELDALDPNDLRTLYEGAIAGWWDNDAFERSMKQERTEDDLLERVTKADPDALFISREEGEAVRDLAMECEHQAVPIPPPARDAVDSLVQQMLEQDEPEDEEEEDGE